MKQRTFLTPDQIAKIYFLAREDKNTKYIATVVGTNPQNVSKTLSVIKKYWRYDKLNGHVHQRYVEAVKQIKYHVMHGTTPLRPQPTQNDNPFTETNAPAQEVTVEAPVVTTPEVDHLKELDDAMANLQVKTVAFVTAEVEKRVQGEQQYNRVKMNILVKDLEEANGKVVNLTASLEAAHRRIKELEEQIAQLTPAQKKWLDGLKDAFGKK